MLLVLQATIFVLSKIGASLRVVIFARLRLLLLVTAETLPSVVESVIIGGNTPKTLDVVVLNKASSLAPCFQSLKSDEFLKLFL